MNRVQKIYLLVSFTVLLNACSFLEEPSVKKSTIISVDTTMKPGDINVTQEALENFSSLKSAFWSDSIAIEYHEFEDSLGLRQVVTHYLPHGTPQSISIVLYFGGGWLDGSAQAMRGYCEGFAQQGFHCFAPSYRTLKSHGTGVEEALWDATQTFQWIQAQADSLNIEPDKIWAGGSSAGGLLAVWQEAQGHLLWVPVLRTTGLNAYTNELITPENNTQVDVTLNLEEKIPLKTTFIFIPRRDNLVPVEGSAEYCEVLTQSRVGCSRYIFDGSGHNLFYENLEMRDYTIFTASEILKFL